MATCSWHTSNEIEVKDCQQLLIAVKSTVERIVATQLPNVWKTYGGLNRLSKDVEQIFNHRLRASNGICDYWQFLLGLRVLLPTLAPVIEKHRVTMEAQGNKSLGHAWILQSLEEHTLSNHLQILLSDKDHLRTCYEDDAFLWQDMYVEAFLLCLKAVDQNDLVLLTELNPELLAKPNQQKYQTHTRSSSFPLNEKPISDYAGTYISIKCLNTHTDSYRDENCESCRNIISRKLRRTISNEYEGQPYRRFRKSSYNCFCSERNNNADPETRLTEKSKILETDSVKTTNHIYLFQKDALTNSVCSSLSSTNSGAEGINTDLDNCVSAKEIDSSKMNHSDAKSVDALHLSDHNQNKIMKQIQSKSETSVEKKSKTHILPDSHLLVSDFSAELENIDDKCYNDSNVENLNFSTSSSAKEQMDFYKSLLGNCQKKFHNCSMSSSRKRFQSGPSFLHASSHYKDLPFVNNNHSYCNNIKLSEKAKNIYTYTSHIQRKSFRSYSESDLNALLSKLRYECDNDDIIKSEVTSSILKLDYGNDTFLTSSTSETEGDVMKFHQFYNCKRQQLGEKVSDDAASINTLRAQSDVTTGSDNYECDVEKSFQNLDSLSHTTYTSRNSDELNKGLQYPQCTANPPVQYTHQRSRSDDISYYNQEDHLSFFDSYQNIENSRNESSQKLRRRSLLEEGGSSVLPMTECFFPQPHEGQSLTSFLSSQDFHTCAELDKENHHFSISEALIAAIEQIKWNEMMKTKTTAVRDEEEEESDEEIQHLKQRIRIRRRERQQEKAQKTFYLLSDGRTDTTTSQSASPFSSPHSSLDYPDTNSSDSVDELVLSGDEAETCNQLVALRDQGLSLSMASLYSDADIHRGNAGFSSMKPHLLSHDKNSSICESLSSSISAESVALSLLKKFSEKQLPKASDLVWLVSEQDAPQRLLPLPTSWPVSPDEHEQATFRLRGNSEWAPPRAQVIFNIHPPPQRKVAIAKQNYRCAGCGMKTELGYIKRFRYCDYLGKYFCQYCHTNYRTYVPARILRKWDFSKNYVSDFSKKLLETMFYDPLFNVEAVNPGLYRRSQKLEDVKNFRQQLYFLKNYINTCRTCEGLQEEFKHLPAHLCIDIHTYSINDLLQVKSGEMSEKLKQLVNKAIAHANICQLCQAKGFICEFCNNDRDIIFPFQIQKVLQCNVCGACYHKHCFSKNDCPKCKRIDERRRRLSQQDDENSD